MFQQLRLKLTLINIGIIVSLFLLLTVGSYRFAQFNLTKQTDIMARQTAADIQSGLINDLPVRGFLPPGPYSGSLSELPPGLFNEPLPSPPPNSFFFVKTSPAGAITTQSSNQPLHSDRITALTEQALPADSPQGIILFDQSYYYYLRSPLISSSGMLVLFHDLSPEKNMLHILQTVLIAVGIICSLLSFGVSYYMANRTIIPIQKAWQQQKDFLSDASHELRTPLTVIQTNLDLVRGNPDETVSSQMKWLDNIQGVNDSMSSLVDSLLFLARTDSKQQALERRPFSLKSGLAQTISRFEPAAAAKGITLEDLMPPLPIAGYGDKARINQVISILLDNAIRHTPIGGKITVYLSQSDVKTFLTVVDTGEGIEQQYLDKIFDRFYQVDKSRHTGSSGLGLAIAKSIVEGHQGTISVYSTPGAGTTFTLEFPWGKAPVKQY